MERIIYIIFIAIVAVFVVVIITYAYLTLMLQQNQFSMLLFAGCNIGNLATLMWASILIRNIFKNK